jgi:hypothetical protein
MPGEISIVLINPQNGSIAHQYAWQSPREVGEYEEILDTSFLQPGNYQMHVYFNGQFQFRNLVKL